MNKNIILIHLKETFKRRIEIRRERTCRFNEYLDINHNEKELEKNINKIRGELRSSGFLDEDNHPIKR